MNRKEFKNETQAYFQC